MGINSVCKEKKEELKLTQNAIAERSGLNPQTVANFFSANSKSPSVYTVGPICKALGVSLDSYFGIIDPSMGAEEIARVKAEYETHKAETTHIIEMHTQRAGHQDDYITIQEKTIAMLEDRIQYQKKAIRWLRAAIGGLVAYAAILDFLSPAIGLIRQPLIDLVSRLMG